MIFKGFIPKYMGSTFRVPCDHSQNTMALNEGELPIIAMTIVELHFNTPKQRYVGTCPDCGESYYVQIKSNEG